MLDAALDAGSNQNPARLLRLRDVQDRVGLGRSTIYRWMDEGKFPRPHPISSHTIRWLGSDIDDWILAKLTPTV